MNNTTYAPYHFKSTLYIHFFQKKQARVGSGAHRDLDVVPDCGTDRHKSFVHRKPAESYSDLIQNSFCPKYGAHNNWAESKQTETCNEGEGNQVTVKVKAVDWKTQGTNQIRERFAHVLLRKKGDF